MILDVMDPYPRIIRGGGEVIQDSDSIVIYVIVSILVALCVVIALKVINKKGSEKNEKK